MELPSSSEKPMSTQGRKGAWKLRRPKKFMRTYGFLRLHTYTSIMVKAWPRNTKLTNRPKSWRVASRNRPTSEARQGRPSAGTEGGAQEVCVRNANSSYSFRGGNRA